MNEIYELTNNDCYDRIGRDSLVLQVSLRFTRAW